MNPESWAFCGAPFENGHTLRPPGVDQGSLLLATNSGLEPEQWSRSLHSSGPQFPHVQIRDADSSPGCVSSSAEVWPGSFQAPRFQDAGWTQQVPVAGGPVVQTEVAAVVTQAGAAPGSAGGQGSWSAGPAPSQASPSTPPVSPPPLLGGPSSARLLCEVRGHPTPSLVPE